MIIDILQKDFLCRETVTVNREATKPNINGMSLAYRVIRGTYQFHIAKNEMIEWPATHGAYTHLATPLFSEMAAGDRANNRLNR